MTELEKLAEQGKMAKEIVVRYARLQQGHENCHYYPEMFEELMKAFDIEYPQDRKLPPRTEFRARCREFESKLYDRKT